MHPHPSPPKPDAVKMGGLVLDTVLHLEPGFVFMKTLEKTTMEEVETISKEEPTSADGKRSGRTRQNECHRGVGCRLGWAACSMVCAMTDER